MATPKIIGTMAQEYDGNVQSVAVAHTLPSGQNRIIVAITSFYDDGGPTWNTCRYDQGGGEQATMTKIWQQIHDDGNRAMIAMWALLEADLPEISGESYDVIAIIDGDPATKMQIDVLTIANAEQTLSIVHNEAGAKTTHIAVGLTPVTNEYLCITPVHVAGTAYTITPDSGEVILDSGANGTYKLGISKEVADGSPFSQGWTASSSNRMVVGSCAYKYEAPIIKSAPAWFT